MDKCKIRELKESVNQADVLDAIALDATIKKVEEDESNVSVIAS